MACKLAFKNSILTWKRTIMEINFFLFLIKQEALLSVSFYYYHLTSTTLSILKRFWTGLTKDNFNKPKKKCIFLTLQRKCCTHTQITVCIYIYISVCAYIHTDIQITITIILPITPHTHTSFSTEPNGECS